MRLSVVMSVYNGAATLDRAIDSILQQSFRDFEFIVVDDGSSDESLALLLDYATSDDRIRVLKNGNNRGLAWSLRRGVAAAGGEYIARMDQDDVATSNRLDVQVRLLDTHPDVDVVGARYWLFTENVEDAWVDASHDRNYRADGVRYGRTPVPHPTCCFRRSLVDRFGSYDSAGEGAEDHDLFARWYVHGARFLMDDRRLLYYRIHASSMTAGLSRRVVRASLRVNIRTVLALRGRFALSGYIYMCKQVLLFIAHPVARHLAGRNRQLRTRHE